MTLITHIKCEVNYQYEISVTEYCNGNDYNISQLEIVILTNSAFL